MSLNSTRSWKGSSTVSEADLVRPISQRPPSLKPLDLGETSLMGKMTLHSRRKSSTSLLWSPKRTEIGPPTDFRRLDPTDAQTCSLKPLQLEPVVLKGHEDDVSSEAVRIAPSVMSASDTDRHWYRDARDPPWQRCQQMSTSPRCGIAVPCNQDESPPRCDTPMRPYSAKPLLSTQSSLSSMRSLHRQLPETSASGTSFSTSRTSVERIRLHRKRSNQSTRMSFADSKDLDQEILELNTIVEERRAEAGRGKSHEDLHIPAVAPRMGLRARSETLCDIGSAFSRPLRLETACQPVQEAVSPVKSPAKFRLSRPFTTKSDSSHPPVQEAGMGRRPSSRVAGWLSNILSTSAASTSDTASQSLYSVRPSRVSSASSSSSSSSSQRSTVTAPESPCHTSTSSAISQEHSRDRSVVSPPSTTCTSDFDTKSTRRRSPGQWGPVDPLGPVGVAL